MVGSDEIMVHLPFKAIQNKGCCSSVTNKNIIRRIKKMAASATEYTGLRKFRQSRHVFFCKKKQGHLILASVDQHNDYNGLL